MLERHKTSVFKKLSRQVLTLTKSGQRLIRLHEFMPDDQVVYSGLVKRKEAEHDSDIYRFYRKAAEGIERKGGKVVRVQLDYELKEMLYERFGRARARAKRDLQRLKETFARDMNLRVVHGKVSFPDPRIEYEPQEMRIARVDLRARYRSLPPRQASGRESARRLSDLRPTRRHEEIMFPTVPKSEENLG